MKFMKLCVLACGISQFACGMESDTNITLNQLNDPYWTSTGEDSFHAFLMNLSQEEKDKQFFIAAKNNDGKKAIALLEAGANVNIKSDNNSTALMLFALRLNQKMVSFLLMHGANPNITNDRGWTAANLWNYNMHVLESRQGNKESTE